MALSISDGQSEPSNFHGPKFAFLADEAGSHINQEELEEVNERFFNSVDGKLQLELARIFHPRILERRFLGKLTGSSMLEAHG